MRTIPASTFQPRLGVTAALMCLVAVCSMLLGGPVFAQTRDPGNLGFWFGETSDGSPIVRLHYFHSPTCEHCKKANPVLDDMESRLPWLSVERYSVLKNPANARFYHELGRTLRVATGSTPGFVFCGQVEIGFDSAAVSGRELERKLTQCHDARVAGIPFEIPHLAVTGEPARSRSNWWLILPIILAAGGFGVFAVAQLRAKRAEADKARIQAERSAHRMEKKMAARERRRKGHKQ